jgi:hypothetical protein
MLQVSTRPSHAFGTLSRFSERGKGGNGGPQSEEGVCWLFARQARKRRRTLEGGVEVAECSLSVTTLLCYDRPNEEMMDSCLREPGLEPLLCSNWGQPPQQMQATSCTMVS